MSEVLLLAQKPVPEMEFYVLDKITWPKTEQVLITLLKEIHEWFTVKEWFHKYTHRKKNYIVQSHNLQACHILHPLKQGSKNFQHRTTLTFNVWI
jgi:hypothetical protein